MTDSCTLELDDVAERSRLTTFFRLLIAIPHVILSYIYNLIATVLAFIAWFVLLFTGRWPVGMYNFVAGAVRFQTRVSGYVMLATDPYPPFDADDHPEYPLRVKIGPPKQSYSRLKVFFRGFFVMPAYIVALLLSIVANFVVLFAWLAILITGRQVEVFQNFLRLTLEWTLKAHVLGLLIAEDY